MAKARRNLTRLLSYLRHKRAWDPGRIKPVDPHGAYGMCHDLVHLGNADREEAVVARLRDLSLNPIPVPIPDEPHSNGDARVALVWILSLTGMSSG